MFDIAIIVANALLSLALVLGFWRLYLGPTLPDRVVALELIASLTIGFIAVYVISSGRTPFIDVAMVLALTAFLAAVGFARYLEKGGHRDDD
ncbi:pH regulation protein F [Thioalkalivibrio versutus]|uniref:pH regulation protein F n=1 Tax=Thioalkalivibrio versutus TaxID=106634 RepID=A0A0G3G2S0_9GAMM|nr:cation:proton antiporter [Thioalkalivibrio versutus]AKJ94674.1 pH regulation protein F [Thioalkalivibrio versutus]